MKLNALVTVVALAWSLPGHAALWPRSPDAAPEATRDGVQIASHGNWDFEAQAGTFMWTGTRSERGSLGQFCNVGAGACAWILVLRGVTCAEGGQYPVLVNTERAAAHHVLQCMGGAGGDGSALAFTDFDRIDSAIRHARQLGIAIPEQEDGIGVARFELTGAAAAIDQMRDELKTALALAATEQDPVQ
jgi:hypothetical protein